MSNDPLDRIDPACERFEDRLAAGETPFIEDFLALVSGEAERRLLFVYLLRLDLEYRPPADWTITRFMLRERFPHLSPVIDRVLDARRPLRGVRYHGPREQARAARPVPPRPH